MADILADEVILLRAPKYAGDPRITPFIALAEEFIGDKIPQVTPREYAKALQVLHWLTMDDRVAGGNTGVGTISEEKEGELTIKYSNNGMNIMTYTSDMKAELGQTIYGLELRAFYRKYILLPRTRFC